jgi:hypothetical protein
VHQRASGAFIAPQFQQLRSAIRSPRSRHRNAASQTMP